VHWGLLVGLAAAVVVWVLVRHTRVGFAMDVVGSSPAAARYAGIPVRRTILTSLLLSGALAGLAGAAEVGGRRLRARPQRAAARARLHRHRRRPPSGATTPSASSSSRLLLGGLRNAGVALQSVPGNNVPGEVSLMLQGAILLFATGGEVFIRNRLVVRRTGGPAGTAAAPLHREAPA
jgi:simple sugar transport system permease protein